MVLYQTSDSNLSAKQSEEMPMIFCRSALSSGSRCWSARTPPGRSKHHASPAKAQANFVRSGRRISHFPRRLTYVEYSLPDLLPGFPSIRSRDDDGIRDFLRSGRVLRSRFDEG